MKKYVLGLLIPMLALAGCQQAVQEQEPVQEMIVEEDKEVQFVAVGDNLIHGLIYYYGDQGDGTYDFDAMYARVSDTISSADVAYLNQETICGGTELGLQSYPTFNSPYEILDGVESFHGCRRTRDIESACLYR